MAKAKVLRPLGPVTQTALIILHTEYQHYSRHCLSFKLGGIVQNDFLKLSHQYLIKRFNILCDGNNSTFGLLELSIFIGE